MSSSRAVQSTTSPSLEAKTKLTSSRGVARQTTFRSDIYNTMAGQAWTTWTFVIAVGYLVTILAIEEKIPLEELDDIYWVTSAQRELKAAIGRRRNEGKARNVILFLGDGMSLSTVTAARIFRGQQEGRAGEESSLSFEDFPAVALAKTYNVDHQVSDSAATATAFLCGVKARYGTIGLGPRAERGDCPGSRGHNATCILELAQRAGKMTGFATTSRVSHATPAPLYASSPDRMWEVDSDLPHQAADEGCTDIAAQMLNPVGRKINVVLGGGRRAFLPLTESDPEYPEHVGLRFDDRNLIEEWISHHTARGLPDRAQYVWNKRQFDEVDPKETDHLMGLFEMSHMKYDRERLNDTAGEPSLADMVTKAVSMLSKSDKGFFLLVEGARIDHAHHENTARKALEETLAFDDAVRRALELVSLQDTLVIVTADHSHPLTIGSYATRGNDILGLTDYSDDENRNGQSDVDFLPYTTLGYANGPGYEEGPRRDITLTDTKTRQYRQATSVPLRIVSHEGTDVPIYAAGPMSHLFHSTHEQNYIFHVMAYAACLQKDSPTHAHCKSVPTSERLASSSVTGHTAALLSTLAVAVLVTLQRTLR